MPTRRAGVGQTPRPSEAIAGIGDWILATGQAKKLNEETGKLVCVMGRKGQPQWPDIFDHNPRLSATWTHKTVRLINGPGVRPYIAAKTPTKWTWKTWDIQPGEIFLSPGEKNYAKKHAGYVLIEPNTKAPDSNKRWVWERWQELAERFDRGTLIQVGPPESRRLHGVHFVETPTFRHACAVLSVSRAYVGTEGGLHHAAAALDVPAVVLWAEFIAPEFTGYQQHRNIRHAGEACGNRLPCAGCRESMLKISVDEVEKNLREIL